MSQGPIVYPPLPEDLERRVSWRSIKYFGAGAIVASVTIASGETLFGSRAGAVFGYALLWCFVAGALMKATQVYSAARYMVLTGEHPMSHWAFLPGPRGWVPITIGLLSLFCFPFWQAGLPLMLGNILNWVFGVELDHPQFWYFARGWATVSIVVSVILVLLQSYKFLERVQTWIVGLLIGCMLAAVAAARPDWWAAFWGIVTPRVPDFPPWAFEIESYKAIAQRSPWIEVMTYMGAVGGGTYDYVGYLGFFREKGWGAIGLRGAHGRESRGQLAAAEPAVSVNIDSSEDNLRRGRRWLLPAQIDIAICFLSVIVVTLCFALLGARILHPDKLVPSGTDLFNYQARFLTNMHPALLYVYQLGIFCAFFGTIYGAFEVYARTAYECIMPVSAWVRRMPFERFRRGIVLYCATLALVFIWTLSMNPDDIVRPAAIIGGVFTCGLWCLAMLWTDRRFMPPPLRMPWLLWIATAISGVVLTSLGVKGIWDFVAGWIAS